MNQLEEGRIEQLLGIINLYPAIRIMHFTDSDDLLSQKIYELCREYKYEYQLNTMNEISYENLKIVYGDMPYVKIKQINPKQPRYVTQAKLYDYLFVNSKISDENRGEFVQRCYSAIKNAGLIVIFISKNDMQEYYIWSDLLTDNNFVAINKLDTFSNYDIIIAKKMHGWGG